MIVLRTPATVSIITDFPFAPVPKRKNSACAGIARQSIPEHALNEVLQLILVGDRRRKVSHVEQVPLARWRPPGDVVEGQ